MIASLSGKVEEKLIDRIILNVSGVGYEVYVSNFDYDALLIDSPIKLRIYEHIREQSYDLYGFMAIDSKQLFLMLLNVNGVGPKMALSILGLSSLNEIKSAIAGGQVKYLTQASGVGKKVAERIVVDLKDKLGIGSVDLDASEIFESEMSVLSDEAMAGLVALGYSIPDARKALSGLDSSLSPADKIKLALKNKH